MKKSVAIGYLGAIMKPLLGVNVMKPSVNEPVIPAAVSGNPVNAVLLASLVLMCGVFVSCGSEDVIPAGVSGDLTNTNDSSNAPTNQRTNEPDYTGKIVIKFKDGTRVRLSSTLDRPEPVEGRGLNTSESPFITTRRDSPREAYEVRRVNEVVRRISPPLEKGGEGGFSRVTSITRVMQESEEEVEKWLAELREKGENVKDWNLYYYLDVPDYEDAVALVRELNNQFTNNQDTNNNQSSITNNQTNARGAIEYAEIIPIFQLAEVLGPDMSSEQGYLKSAAQGGLGIEEAWAQGIFGQNTMVIDQEYDWNFDHEILPIDETLEYIYNPLQIGKNDPVGINHGTAAVGIIAGQGNDINKGIKGIVPQTAMRVASIELGAGLMGASPLPLVAVRDYADSYLLIGSVYTIEVQRKGITTTAATGCAVGDGVNSPLVTGCVPLEASQFVFDVIQLGVASGKVIIEGAGNGGINLNDDNIAKPKDGEYSYFNDNDSGATMVGASLGADKRKAAWSNCGDRVDVFAWGQGVVTAGYGDKFNPDGANPNVIGPMGADNPHLYTGQFGGTSAATAQIAGMAALIQSYVRQLVAEAGYEPKVVYLDSKQMRTILKASGQPAVYGQTPNDPNPNCSIGVQPDMAQVFKAVNDFLNADNVLKVVPLNKEAMEGLTGGGGIIYDMDGDGRAELISFSRDHKWYIDLSSVDCTGPSCAGDGYGAWDMILTPPPFEPDAMLFPVVNDYSPDGLYNTKRLADLSVYDAVNGKWYIRYTRTNDATLNLGVHDMAWDGIIDYSNDPMWKPYSRPVPGNYNGDGFLDTALQTPDGHWVIDYGGNSGIRIQLNDGAWVTATSNGEQPDESEGQWVLIGDNVQVLDHFGTFDKDVKYLTDEQLAQAPGWAWLPLLSGDTNGNGPNIVSKVPDGLSNAGDIYIVEGPEFITNHYYWGTSILGDNSDIITSAGYDPDFPGLCCDLGLKHSNGNWDIALGYDWWMSFSETLFKDLFGDINCRPIPADYDNDNIVDRSVQCGTNWKIAYSSDASGSFREIELTDALDPLPAFVYSGGIKYQDIVELYNYYKGELGGTKSSTIFDAPPPIGPYFAQCVKYWAPNASYCWDK